MKFSEFAKYLQKLEETSSRTEMSVIMQKLLVSLEPNEVQEALYMMLGRVAPKYESLEFNVAEKIALRSIAEGYSKDVDAVRRDYKTLGDVGLVAEKYANEKRNKGNGLSVLEVFKRLKEVAEFEGEGSQERKVKKLGSIATESDQVSNRYIFRIVLNTLRLGAGDKTIIDALSWTQTKDKSLSKQIERAYALCSDLGFVGETLLKGSIKEIEKIKLNPGRPVFAKLTQRADTPKEVHERMPTCYIQPKLDGLRCQIHKWEEKRKGGKTTKVALFSRNLEPLTHMFPEIVAAAKKLPAKSFILDSEVIGYNPKTQEFHRFQETIQRRRKHNIGEKAEQIPVYAFGFDILYLNGQDLTLEPYEKRLEKFKQTVNEKKQNTIKLVETKKVNSKQKIEKLFDQYVSDGLEGLMAKTPDHKYAPGTRNYDWIKLKRAYKAKLADTVDAVVLGYYSGRGKQAKLGIGAFLVGVYDKKNDKFVTIAKVGTGVTEKEWGEIKKKLDKISVKKLPVRVEIAKTLVPDVLVDPQIVCVIKADEVTKSPLHTAKYALRFPRLDEFDRADKTPESVTTVTEVKQMHDTFGKQVGVKKNRKA